MNFLNFTAAGDWGERLLPILITAGIAFFGFLPLAVLAMSRLAR